MPHIETKDGEVYRFVIDTPEPKSIWNELTQEEKNGRFPYGNYYYNQAIETSKRRYPTKAGAKSVLGRFKRYSIAGHVEKAIVKWEVVE